MTEGRIHYVTRDELIEFMKEIDSEYGIPGSDEHAERNADEFIRRFFRVDPLPDRIPIITLDDLGNSPIMNVYAEIFEETPSFLTQTRGEVHVVKTQTPEEES